MVVVFIYLQLIFLNHSFSFIRLLSKAVVIKILNHVFSMNRTKLILNYFLKLEISPDLQNIDTKIRFTSVVAELLAPKRAEPSIGQ